MSRDINLVIKEGTEQLKHKKKLKTFRIVTAAFLLMVLLISLSIYLLSLRLGSPSTEKDKPALFNQLLSLREKEAKLKVVNDRLHNIPIVQNNNRGVYKIVNTLLGEVPGGMLVDSLEFTGELLVVKVSSDSLILLDALMNNLIDLAERREIINTLILNSLDVADTGQFSVSINIGLI